MQEGLECNAKVGILKLTEDLSRSIDEASKYFHQLDQISVSERHANEQATLYARWHEMAEEEVKKLYLQLIPENNEESEALLRKYYDARNSVYQMEISFSIYLENLISLCNLLSIKMGKLCEQFMNRLTLTGVLIVSEYILINCCFIFFQMLTLATF